jgi:NUMOD3 motif
MTFREPGVTSSRGHKKLISKGFYTYEYLRSRPSKDGIWPAGSPYYVGKGQGKRATSGCHGLLSRPRDKDFIVKVYWPDEATAFCEEKRLIHKYGRIDLGTGCLHNHSDGGDGPAGLVHTVETKLRMAESHRGLRHTLETRERISKSLRGIKFTQEHILNISLAQQRRHSVLVRPVVRKFIRGTLEYRVMMSEVCTVAQNRLSVKSRNSMALKALWADPIWRSKMLEARRIGRITRLSAEGS